MYRCFVPFHLADPGGILFFGHTLALMHQAFEAFVMQELGCPWKEWFENPQWIVPIVHVEASFFSPIKAGEECSIKIEVENCSRSSFSLASTLLQQSECAVVRTVHVFCQRNSKKKEAIPAIWATKLAALHQKLLIKSPPHDFT